MTKLKKEFKELINNQAHYKYFVTESLVAGLVLEGWEAKAIRAGRFQFNEAYVYFRDGAPFLIGSLISPLMTTNSFELTDPSRTRKLLMNGKEIEKWEMATKKERMTVIPLKCFVERGKFKMLIGLCKGKDHADKRDTLKAREADREAARELKKGA